MCVFGYPNHRCAIKSSAGSDMPLLQDESTCEVCMFVFVLHYALNSSSSCIQESSGILGCSFCMVVTKRHVKEAERLRAFLGH